MSKVKTDIIPAGVSGTLAGLFRERVKRSPDKVAYRQFHENSRQWRDTTWQEMATEVARWQDALTVSLFCCATARSGSLLTRRPWVAAW